MCIALENSAHFNGCAIACDIDFINNLRSVENRRPNCAADNEVRLPYSLTKVALHTHGHFS